MSKQDKPSTRPPRRIEDTLSDSQADLAAQRWEDFDDFLTRVERKLADAEAD